MEDEALAGADELEKVEAQSRNKCRVLAIDFDWKTIDDMVLSTEMVELGKQLDELADSNLKNLKKDELIEEIAKIRDQFRQAAIAESKRSGPRNEGRDGEGDEEEDAAAAKKHEDIVANRADIAARQADNKGLEGLAKDKAIAEAVEKAEKKAAEKANKELEAALKKATDAEAREKKAQQDREKAEAAQKAEEAARKAEERKTRQREDALAQAQHAAVEAAIKAAKEQSAKPVGKEELNKLLEGSKKAGKKEKKRKEPEAPSNEGREKDGEQPEIMDAAEDMEDEEPKPEKKKRRTKKQIIEEEGQEAWDALQDDKQEKLNAAAEKKRKIDNFDEVHKAMEKAQKQASAADKLVKEYKPAITKKQEELDELQKTYDKALLSFNKIKRTKKVLLETKTRLMELAGKSGASAQQIKACIDAAEKSINDKESKDKAEDRDAP